jgi:uncharacterized protein YjlB
MFDSSHDRDGHSVDFLIVGGGAAGSVLGARLSEDSCRSAALIRTADPGRMMVDPSSGGR